jgi:hypothetical protein
MIGQVAGTDGVTDAEAVEGHPADLSGEVVARRRCER